MSVRAPVRGGCRAPARALGRRQFVGALDGLTVSGAWSIARRLRRDYTGPLIRLRRSSDDAELDIGADGAGALLAAVAAAFIDGGSGFVTTVYDQVGTNDLVQATAAEQPGYLAAGINGLPTADFNGTSHLLRADGLAATFSGADVPCATILVAKTDTIGVDQTMYSLRNSVDLDAYLMGRIINVGSLWRFLRGDDAGTTAAPQIGTPDTDPHVVAWLFAGTTAGQYVDGTALYTASAMNVGVVTLDRFAVGASFAASAFQWFNGRISEVVVAAGDLPDYRAAAVDFYGTA